MPVEKREKLAFGQSILFIMLFSQIWAPDIWPMTNYVGAVKEFFSELLSSWAIRVKIYSLNSVLQELRCSHKCNTSRERNTKIKSYYKTGSNEHYSRGSEMIKGPSFEINCNLQLDECTVWVAAKYKSSTSFLANLTRSRPGLTHVGNIPLELLRYTSGQVAGPQFTWGMTVYSLTDIPLEESKSLAFNPRIPFIVLFN